jgi:hypothetical protein
MATVDVNAPAVGRHGEPCATCGAPLAADQRYCLACGARRARVRAAFRDILAAGPAPATERGAVEDAEAPTARSGATFLAGVACLLLALGAGVLIGRSGGGGATTAATPPPQVISIAAPAAPASTTAAPTTSAGATSTAPAPKAHERAPASAKGGSKATNPALKKLEGTSGKAFEKQSRKLPKTVSTGGKPPPKDHKPAGGGTGFQNIG